MNEITLNARVRETGRKNAKKLRNNGVIPGVFYIKGEDSIPIETEKLNLRSVVYTGTKKIIDLQLDDGGDVKNCLLKDVVFDPITDEIVHFDLLGVKKGQKLTVEVPFVLSGTPIGIKSGGILQQSLYKTKITCLPKDYVEAIEVNVSKLELNGTITLGDVAIENIEFDLSLDSVICSVVVPKEIETEPDIEEGEVLEEGEEAKGASEGQKESSE